MVVTAVAVTAVAVTAVATAEAKVEAKGVARVAV